MIFAGNRPLLEAYRRGERHALTAVYHEYVASVVDVLTHGFQFESGGRTLRFAGFSDPLELEGCVQDIFVAVFSQSARHGYDGLRPFAPYVLQIARNRVIDELRRRRAAVARMGAGPEEGATDVASTEPPPDEQVDREQARRLVS
ncbi:MAG: hypothetical protein HYZ27_04955, partial [Deltaproteobacteria bacterium]|nr:hypothetical protein [Deltaproteobacteria bacterium]